MAVHVRQANLAPPGSTTGSPSNPSSVIGTLTNNNAAPVALSLLGVLSALANAANPTWTEGDLVTLSVGLSGGLRVMGLAANGATAVGNPVLVAGFDYGSGSNQVQSIGVDISGRLTVVRQLAAADAESNNIGFFVDRGTASNVIAGTAGFAFNGATWDRLRTITIGNAVAATGILAAGAYGEYLSTAPAPASGQYSALQTDYAGNLFTKHIRRSQVKAQATTIANSAVATTVITAPGAGIFADMSRLILSVVPLAAGTAPTSFTATLSDGTNNFIYDMQADQLGTAALISNPTQILDLNFDPSLPATTAATAWTITLSVATVTVHITAVAILQKAS
jgi:hypothetical protein